MRGTVPELVDTLLVPGADGPTDPPERDELVRGYGAEPALTTDCEVSGPVPEPIVVKGAVPAPDCRPLLVVMFGKGYGTLLGIPVGDPVPKLDDDVIVRVPRLPVGTELVALGSVYGGVIVDGPKGVPVPAVISLPGLLVVVVLGNGYGGIIVDETDGTPVPVVMPLGDHSVVVLGRG